MQGRNTILIVDDSVDSLNFLTDALDSAGFTVLVALSGDSAIALVNKVVPDIVLMDAVMPGMDGFETCRSLKTNSAYVDLPIIFMTGLSETEHVIRGFQAGGVDYVTKPIVPNELLARVECHLGIAQTARSAKTALDLTGRFLVAIDRSGKTVWRTPQASRLINEVLGFDEFSSFNLPPELSEWLAKPSQNAIATTRMQINDRSLEFAYVGKVSEREIIFRISLDDQNSEKKKLRNKFGLTDREADVLFWISAGKANKDIAKILGLSPRTVNKYLDYIYAKMGVENRATAAAHAVRLLSST